MSSTAPAGRLVGRETELARLRSLWAETATDGSRCVLIGGDAGAGKTSLVEAFVAEATEAGAGTVVRGQCVALGGDGLPYAPIVGALRGLLARHDAKLVLDWAGAGRAALGVLLPDLIAPPPEHPSLRLQLFEAVARVLEAATQQSRLIVVFEDVHWADESTRHLVRFLARALPDAPVLMLVTFRSDEVTRRHPLRPFLAEVGRLAGVARVEVGGLDRDQVADLVQTLSGERPSRAVVDLVHTRSEGIPYFVAELVESASRGCVELPETLRDALSVRVQTLSDAAQRVLQVAAIGGYRVDHALLEAVEGRSTDELETGLREAIDAGLLVIDDDAYAFRHALLREVVHDDVLPGSHARLHARFATVLEQRPDLARDGTAAIEIAHHWAAAHDADQAFRWAWQAAEASGSAHLEALKLYERALELWDRVSDPESIAGSHVGLLVRAVHAARLAGESERALELNKAALAETPAEDVEGRIKRWVVQGKTLSFLMRPGGAEALQQAVALVPDDAPAYLRAKVLDALAMIVMITGGDAAPPARDAIDAAEQAHDVALQANAWNTLGAHLVNAGDEVAGLEAFARCSALLRSDDGGHNLRYQVNYSDALNHAGRYREAAEVALAGIGAAAELGFERSTGAMLAGNAAEPLLAVGDWPRARHLIERALELGPPVSHLMHLRVLSAWLQIWSGQPDRAATSLVELQRLLRGPIVIPQYAALNLRIVAEQAMAVGEPERAWQAMASYLDELGGSQAAMLYPLLVPGAAAAYACDQADPAGRRVQRIRKLLGSTPPMTITTQLLPVIEAELSDTVETWRAAWESLDELGSPAHLRPYAGWRLAQHLVESRDRAAAREVAVAAHERSRELGAGLLVARLESLAQRAGFPLGASPVPAVADPLAGLTPRETEVLRLLADGRSNGDIGRELFISTKTASVHVSNILAKLGVGGRGEAAALAHRSHFADTVVEAEVIPLRRAR